MIKQCEGFQYLRVKCPKLSEVKLKDVISIGPQIREIINDNLLEHLLTETEKSAWVTFKAVCLNFLENVKAENYRNLFRTCETHTRLGGVLCH